MAFQSCYEKLAIVLILASAVLLGFLASLEFAKPGTQVFHYYSSGFFRECAKWDDNGRRFLVSLLEGGIAEVAVSSNYTPGSVLRETVVVRDEDLIGNASLGITIDRPRNRLLVAVSDVLGNKHSALASYDIISWKRLFLTQLSGPNDEKSLADDVAVDGEGNAYVTDAKGSKIWKVSKDGDAASIISSSLFVPTEWYKRLVGLNGIVYHPGNYLIAIHTSSGKLYKIDIARGNMVKVVEVSGGPLTFGDGLELLSPTQLVVAGNPSGRLVESHDGWETASLVAKFKGPAHRLATAATVKDGKVYLNHLIGLGYPKKMHAIVEAIFFP